MSVNRKWILINSISIVLQLCLSGFDSGILKEFLKELKEPLKVFRTNKQRRKRQILKINQDPHFLPDASETEVVFRDASDKMFDKGDDSTVIIVEDDNEAEADMKRGKARERKQGKAREGRQGKAREGKQGKAREGRQGKAREGKQAKAREGKQAKAREGKQAKAREGKQGKKSQKKGKKKAKGKRNEENEVLLKRRYMAALVSVVL